jgi:hypothetical protein
MTAAETSLRKNFGAFHTRRGDGLPRPLQEEPLTGQVGRPIPYERALTPAYPSISRRAWVADPPPKRGGLK